MQPTSQRHQKLTPDILAISAGHLLNDFYTSFLAPLLPKLIERLSLSLTSAGILASFLQLPSVLYPLFGYLADKKGARFLVMFSPALTATLMSLLGITDSFWNLALILFLAGISSTLFHTASPGMVANASRENKGAALSFFTAGGGLGRSMGPILVVWAVSVWGIAGMYRLLLLGWITSLLLYLQFRRLSFAQEEKTIRKTALPAFGQFFIPLSLVIVLRSFLTAALGSYIPVLLVQSGSLLSYAGGALSILEISGVLGALLIGPASDIFGRRITIITSQVLSAVLIPFFLLNDSWQVLLLLLIGFFYFSTGTLFLALVQDNFPNHRSTGNGIYSMINFLSNGLMVILVGFVGDRLGLNAAFIIGAAGSLLAIPVLLLVPSQPGSIQQPER
jgi:FSR family fosmidomycin resistance protein-like MFS transporter